MITTLDTYFKVETKIEEPDILKYQAPEESQSKKEAKEAGYAYEEMKTIAKWIRKDLKTEFGNTIKFSVTSCRYPREINVKVKEISKEYIMDKDEFYKEMMWSSRFDEYMYNDYMEAYETGKFKRYHLKEEIDKKITKIINKYNYDNSDPYTDYFDCNYYDFWEIRSDVTIIE